MAFSQQQIDALLELERRGKLSLERQSAIQEMRSRGNFPDPISDVPFKPSSPDSFNISTFSKKITNAPKTTISSQQLRKLPPIKQVKQVSPQLSVGPDVLFLEFAETAGLGIPSKIISAIGAASETIRGGPKEIRSVVEEADPGFGERLRESFKRQQKDIRQVRKRGKKELPGLSFLGGMLGLAVPGSRIAKGVSKTPIIGKGLKSRSRLKKGLARIGASTAEATALAAVDPEMEIDKTTVGFGTAADLATRGLIKGVTGSVKLFKMIKQVGAGELAAETPVLAGMARWAKKFKKILRESKISELEKAQAAEDVMVAGDIGQKGIRGVVSKASETYWNFKNALLRRFGKNPVNVEPLRNAIDDAINKIGEFARDLDPDDKRLFDTLKKWRQRLAPAEGAVTLRDLDDLTATLFQKKKKFTQLTPVHKAARQNLMNAVDEAVQNTKARAPKFRKAQRIRKEAIGERTAIEKDIRETPFIDKSSIRARERQMQKLREAASESVDDANKVVEQMISGNETEAAMAREAYREARKEIATVLRDVEESSIGKLIKKGIDPADAVRKAATTGGLRNKATVKAALNASERLKEPLKALVAGDIFNSAKSVRTFSSSIRKYNDVLDLLFSSDETKALRNLAEEAELRQITPFEIPQKIQAALDESPNILRSFGFQLMKLESSADSSFRTPQGRQF